METREAYMSRILQQPALLKFNEIRFIHASQVLTSAAVRQRCLYTCSQTRQSHLNPPFSPSSEETRRILDEYRYGLMVRRELAAASRAFLDAWTEFSAHMLEFERQCFVRGYPRAFAMAVGNCLYGHHDDSLRPCDYPEKNRPTFEAAGIDLSVALEMINWDGYLVRDPEDPFQMFGLLMVE